MVEPIPIPGHVLAERCAILLVEGTRVEGELQPGDGGWWRVLTDEGEVLVAPTHVVAIATAGGLPAPKPTRRSGASSGGSPGRPWSDEDLRALADAFLDGETDKDLAARFGRTPAIVRQLRQGFEVARGNLDQDQATEIAVTWVGRWREVLTS